MFLLLLISLDLFLRWFFTDYTMINHHQKPTIWENMFGSLFPFASNKKIQENLVNHGINYQPQLVITGFNHQYDRKSKIKVNLPGDFSQWKNCSVQTYQLCPDEGASFHRTPFFTGMKYPLSRPYYGFRSGWSLLIQALFLEGQFCTDTDFCWMNFVGAPSPNIPHTDTCMMESSVAISC